MSASANRAYLFGVVLLMFFGLRVVEKYFPRRDGSRQDLKASFKTNSDASMVDDVIKRFLSLSGLVIVAPNYSSCDLPGGLADGTAKGIASFILFDLSVDFCHYIGRKYGSLWRFHALDFAPDVFVKCFRVVLCGVPAHIVVVCERVRMFFVLFHRDAFMFPGEKYLSCGIVTPCLHRACHAAPGDKQVINHGIVLSVRDWLFGTRKGLVPESTGLEMIVAESIARLFGLAFLTERQLARLRPLVSGSPA